MAKSRKAKQTKKPNAKRVTSSRRRKAPAVSAFYARAATAAPTARGTSGGEFAWAIGSNPERSRLRKFLKQHEPADGEYEDGYHLGRVRAAQVELMRLEFLHGNVKAGDRLLARLIMDRLESPHSDQ